MTTMKMKAAGRHGGPDGGAVGSRGGDTNRPHCTTFGHSCQLPAEFLEARLSFCCRPSVRARVERLRDDVGARFLSEVLRELVDYALGVAEGVEFGRQGGGR
jgi:hypothetical protein